ncbi:hypothetical protein QBC99_000455 [Beijerinckia sp. GAS462]|nr:hypothetical protein [Beijerinckia sp. GAS462]SEB60842.1 hypothetical protein SAMN05443249_0662 [Beijerinckia sp. 28-YEA-48]
MTGCQWNVVEGTCAFAPMRQNGGMIKLSIAVSIIALTLTGCASSPPPASAPIQGQAKRIQRDGGQLVLPDGARVTPDASGGFTLPNGDRVNRDRSGALVLKTGARCLPDPAGYSCP